MKLHTSTKALAVTITLILYLMAFVVAFSGNTQSTFANIVNEASYIGLSFDETVLRASYIIDAEYKGSRASKYGNELIFVPTNTIKGEIALDEQNQAIIKQHGMGRSKQEFKKGYTYMLFLEEESPNHHEQGKYVQLGDVLVSSVSWDWDECHEKTKAILTEKASYKSAR